MLNSKQLIEITGISRATLNNYVALGILPNPVVKHPTGEAGRATRLGYFEDDAIDCINKVQELKKEGKTMAQIANEIGSKTSVAAPAPTALKMAIQESSEGEQGSLTNLSFEASIDNFSGPAYMVNNNFELIWWNDKATDSLFSSSNSLPGDLESRNLLKLLFSTPVAENTENLQEIIKPHMAAGKKRLSQQALIKIYSALDARQLSILKDMYEDVEPVGKEAMVHYPTILPGKDGNPMLCDLYVCFYREGILFTFSPVVLNDDFLLDFLSKRNHVISELLKKRKPYLTNVTVMVADVQNSTRICSELPAEEYFELINNIWQESEPIFRKYYGTYGKHAGDGMVYYFFPQPDCDYKINAIQCSLELQQMMKNITRKWQAKKGWFADIHLNIGLNEGQEWFGSYHAGGHVEFTVLGETINYASRVSDFARQGSVWATKNMLNQIPATKRKDITFGTTRKTTNEESVFVTDTYASLGSLLDDELRGNTKFRDIEMLPITEVRSISNIPK
jgi:adenylate cyclase